MPFCALHVLSYPCFCAKIKFYFRIAQKSGGLFHILMNHTTLLMMLCVKSLNDLNFF